MKKKIAKKVSRETKTAAEKVAVPAWVRKGLPSPEQLLQDAAAEAAEVLPDDYLGVIGTLRNKGLSWRRIAAWFAQRGFEFSHVAIYRAYQDMIERSEEAVGMTHGVTYVTDEEADRHERGES